MGHYKYTIMKSKYQIAFAEYLETLSGRDLKYAKQLYCGAIKFGDKFLLLDKKAIKTEFWFSDEGNEFKEFCEITATEQAKIDYFMTENLSRYDLDLGNEIYISKLYVSGYNKNVLQYYSIKRLQHDKKENISRMMTADEISEYENGLLFARNELQKRLDSYLKRYGASKLRFSTFFADY